MPEPDLEDLTHALALVERIVRTGRKVIISSDGAFGSGEIVVTAEDAYFATGTDVADALCWIVERDVAALETRGEGGERG